MEVVMLTDAFAADRVLLPKNSTQNLADAVALDLIGTSRARRVTTLVSDPATLTKEEVAAVRAGGSSVGGGSAGFPAAPISLPDLAAVAVATVPAPGTPANEYLDTGGALTSTDGSSIWGGHQHRFVVMSDGTAFCAVLTPTDILLRRSASGGTYGSAWTTVATIANSGRAAGDLDVHLLRNPATDQVHLVASSVDGGVSRYRIRTYSLAGSLVNDYFMPDTWIGSGNAAAAGWFASTISAGTKYSWAGIGDDGTIAFGDAISSGSYLGKTYTEYDACLRMQFLRWDGATWRASRIYANNVGARMSYHSVAVSPPGREGYVVGICGRGVKVSEWNRYHNPNYPGVGVWPNIDADTSYFGTSGLWPVITRWEVPLSDPTAFSSSYLRAPDFATADQSASTPADFDEYGAYTYSRARIDRAGRWWMQYSKGNKGTLATDTFVLVVDALGNDLYEIPRADYWSSGQVQDFVFDARNKAWVIGSSQGGTVDARILSTTESGGALTIQTAASATNQAAAGATAYGANLGTSRFETFGTLRTPQLNNGSVPTNNWFDFAYHSAGDHTGTAPGTAAPAWTDGAVKTKRVRLQVPVT